MWWTAVAEDVAVECELFKVDAFFCRLCFKDVKAVFTLCAGCDFYTAK